MLASTFLLNEIKDLWKLILWPDVAPYSFRICFLILASALWHKKIESNHQQKNKWDIEGVPRAIRHPCIRKRQKKKMNMNLSLINRK